MLISRAECVILSREFSTGKHVTSLHSKLHKSFPIPRYRKPRFITFATRYHSHPPVALFELRHDPISPLDPVPVIRSTPISDFKFFSLKINRIFVQVWWPAHAV